jgi:hypothetical protein
MDAPKDENVATMTTRDTGLPIARQLAEMLLTQIDLANSRASLKTWIDGYDSEGKEDEHTKAIRGSLFRDFITQFVGCFDSKNAFPLVVETIFPNVNGTGPYFRWLRSLRNSYTAHRHGAARQCSVGAFIDPTSGAYLGRGELFAVYTGPSKEGHAQLLSIVEMTIRYVENRIAILRIEFDAQVGAIASVDRLKFPVTAVQPQAPEDMGKSRGDVSKGIAREHGDTPR